MTGHLFQPLGVSVATAQVESQQTCLLYFSVLGVAVDLLVCVCVCVCMDACMHAEATEESVMH